MAPITPVRSPAAGSTTSQCSTSARPGRASETVASAPAAAAATSAPPAATRPTARAGTAAAASAVSAGAATTASASVSRLVTQAPERRRVAASELGEDPLVEDDRDERDQGQVEGDAELDRHRRPAARELERGEREPVLDQHDPEHLEERRPPRCDGHDPEGGEGEHATLGVPGIE